MSSARGLTTSPIPYGDRTFELDFDFLDHELRVSTSDGGQKEIALYPRSVADFYAELMRSLSSLGIDVRINELPNEIPDAIRFSEDHVHASYDREFAQRFWRILVQSTRVLARFRTSFIGKCSPVHFFWGSFDLAVTRFSGTPGAAVFRRRRACRTCPRPWCSTPIRTRSAAPGSGPGGQGVDYAAFYSYASPSPPGFGKAPVRPQEAFWNQDLNQYLLPYDAVRTAGDPEEMLMEFLTSTYEAAASAGNWDRAALETPVGVPGVPRKVQ